MKTGPLVSVLMGNYNYADYLGQAIDSVLHQTYHNFEFIIVDDGSTDGSRSVLGSYSDPRLHVIYQDNGGQASTFNRGFSVSQGEIVAFIDSDDWWREDKLQTLVDWHIFLRGRYSILQHTLDIWFNGELRPYKNILPVGDCFSEMKSTSNLDYFVPTSGLSFPRKVLERIFPIPLEFKIAADAYLMRTAFIFSAVYSIPKSLGFYRQHDNTVFRNKDFDSRYFFENTLYPHLNAFYRKNDIDFQLTPASNSTLDKMLYLLKSKLSVSTVGK